MSAVLADLGVSSPQVDQAERGFSYRGRPLGPDRHADGPDRGRPASELLNHASEADLRQILRDFADERHAGRIAQASSRPGPCTRPRAGRGGPVRGARTGPAPGRRPGEADLPGPAHRGQRRAGRARPHPRPGARRARRRPAAVISYHSGEDRIVKARFRTATDGGCACPPGLPVRLRCGGDRPSSRATGRHGGADERALQPRRLGRLRRWRRSDPPRPEQVTWCPRPRSACAPRRTARSRPDLRVVGRRPRRRRPGRRLAPACSRCSSRCSPTPSPTRCWCRGRSGSTGLEPAWSRRRPRTSPPPPGRRAGVTAEDRRAGQDLGLIQPEQTEWLAHDPDDGTVDADGRLQGQARPGRTPAPRSSQGVPRTTAPTRPVGEQSRTRWVAGPASAGHLPREPPVAASSACARPSS